MTRKNPQIQSTILLRSIADLGLPLNLRLIDHPMRPNFKDLNPKPWTILWVRGKHHALQGSRTKQNKIIASFYFNHFCHRQEKASRSVIRSATPV